jgi:uncharacterized membrane protein
MMSEKGKVTCQITGQELDRSQAINAQSIRPIILELIKKEHPDFDEQGFICKSELDRYWTKYTEAMILREKGSLSDLEKEVLETISQYEILSSNLNEEYGQKLTFGERVSDRIAAFGGSWSFLGIYVGVLALWIILNSAIFLFVPFDPYPFIFLNLVLSGLAAMQAPVILMSQNRQDARDRLRAEHDFKVNLKAELEIRNLHEKIDQILNNQWQRLMDWQEMQGELLQELTRRVPKPTPAADST